ncbi:RES family NAD+ phosphorylase [Xanthomonas arboricola pv. pruni]|uniref:RES family NAD+ phosphorylase n=1 Tax=Xanthomonas campestris pv. juglandis TaxID=195709 RepID=A0A7U7DCY1_XANCJ|nr:MULTISPECIES: RES family NAD+ phosphorylase [Gammaproteobacteria]ASW45290.1 hypothetical protein XJ27_04330 [Xanthomonas hortorum]AZU17726.1 hypothetical protein AC613_11740 [Xanthomonas citri pv. fuscans]AZU21770.1 hypothetical protein AC612_11750 [Xanthomonas citri pv. fuscans]AZU92989.1 hypothetical protein AC614_11745 [Xanthomonas citri pv. fuscans]KHS36168.1 hypothetical protein RN19_13935 [Xanthomonas phaseoli pv. phaseoli]
MAKRRAKPIADDEPASGSSSVTPEPSADLQVTFTELAVGTMLHRVHHSQYQADEFNPGVRGNARFSPIQDTKGQAIPTLYAGTTLPCALMETVFHDVPHTPGFKSFDKAKLAEQVHSTVQVEEALQVIDLSSVPLRKLGVTRKQLIDTEKDQYPGTRKWAMAIHGQFPQSQGLSWVSRQDDSARAVMLFGDRISKAALQTQGSSRSLTDDAGTYDAVLDLADRIGVAIISGKS